MNRSLFRAVPACFALFFTLVERPAAAPEFADSGFVLETVATLPAKEPVGLTWAPDGSMYIWQDNGVVRVFKDGVLLPTPFIDLRGKVNTVVDRGMLGFALDPDFANNGYAYLLYTYEENGVPSNPGPKTSRLTRVTADPANRHVAVPGSEVVILGKTTQTPCIDHPAGTDCIGSDSHSHTIGTIRFAKDGKLLVSIGDGASYSHVDTNALRSQDLNRYEGKILRINKDGTAPGDNPFDDGTQSIRSKVYSYGLRNPYRFGIEPVSGEIFIGDVGWNNWEEINTGKGKNFGWPCFEGTVAQQQYQDRFQACRDLPREAVTFGVHTYGGPDGHSAIGGAFLSSSAYPAKYKGSFYFADYSANVLRRMEFGADGKKSGVFPFLGKAEGPCSIEMGPDGHLYYISLSSGQVRRIAPFSGAPIAKASASHRSGASPLFVTFSSEGSVDPGGQDLDYLWYFGDGDYSDAPNPVHKFAPTATATFKVKLTVTNPQGKTATDTLSITVGSSPPRAAIIAPLPGDTVFPGDTVRYHGSVSDSDEVLDPESMSWSVVLHHNDHEHPYSTITGPEGYFVAEYHGAGEYFYEVTLTAADGTGLQDTQRVVVVMADPPNVAPVVLAGDSQRVAIETGATLKGSVSDDGLPDPPGEVTLAWSLKSGPDGGEVDFAHEDSLQTKATFNLPGEYVLRLTASDGGDESASEVRITVAPKVIKPGANADARLFVDLDPTTPAADSVAEVRTGSHFWAAIGIAEAVALGGYEVELSYDTVGLEYSQAVSQDTADGWINMLAGLGGVPQATVSAPSAANGRTLTVSGSLARGDSLKCPGGTGSLAWVQFKARSPGRYLVKIREATLKDKDGNENAPAGSRLRGGAVDAQMPTAIARAGRLSLGDREPFRLSLQDTRGRLIYRAEGRGESLAGHISEAAARRRTREVYILRIFAPSLHTPMVLVLDPAMD